MKHIMRAISLLVILATLFAVPTFAADEIMPLSSAYLDSYAVGLEIYTAKANTLQIWFDVSGQSTLDKIGSTRIILQRSKNKTAWTNIKTFWPESYPNMLEEDTGSHTCTLKYTVATNYYYRAYITIYGEKNGGSDSRYLYTRIVQLGNP